MMTRASSHICSRCGKGLRDKLRSMHERCAAKPALQWIVKLGTVRGLGRWWLGPGTYDITATRSAARRFSSQTAANEAASPMHGRAVREWRGRR
jgi:hypothetical protein